jgi:hypothetical protein
VVQLEPLVELDQEVRGPLAHLVPQVMVVLPVLLVTPGPRDTMVLLGQLAQRGQLEPKVLLVPVEPQE